MAFFICFHDGGGVTFEAAPNGERSVPVNLDARAAKTVAALLALDSLEVAATLGAVYMAGASAGERAVRLGPSAAGGSRPEASC
jgi:hypothetical protein